MKKFLLGAILALAISSSAVAQSSPGLIYKQVPTAAQWNSYFAAKQDVLGYTPVNRAGDAMQGHLYTAASAVGQVGFRIPQGAAPSAPTNGDVWTTSAGLFVRINGATVGPILGAARQINGSGIVASLAASTTYYAGMQGGFATTETGIWIPTPILVTIKNLQCQVGAALGATQTVTCTLRSGVNGSLADSPVTCQITVGLSTCLDSTHSVSVPAGQSYDVKFVTSAGVAVAGGGWGVEIDN